MAGQPAHPFSTPAECRRQAEKARAAGDAAHQQVAGLEAALREVRGRVEQRRADINSQTSQGAVVKALMEARKRGEIEGIHGRLGECRGAGLASECDTRGSLPCFACFMDLPLCVSPRPALTFSLPLHHRAPYRRRPGRHCQGLRHRGVHLLPRSGLHCGGHHLGGTALRGAAAPGGRRPSWLEA